MSNERILSFIALALAVIGFVVGHSYGLHHAEISMQAQAVEHGAGCYYLDENHVRQFRWGACDE